MNSNLLLTLVEQQAMVKRLAKPGEQIFFSLTPVDCHILHMLVGLFGELCEFNLAYLDLKRIQQYLKIQNMFKTQDIEKETQYIKNNYENLKEELGDIHFFMIGLGQGLEEKYKIKLDPNDINFSMDENFSIKFEILLDHVKKAIFYRKEFSQETIKKVYEEAYIGLHKMHDTCNITMEEALKHNQEKLLKGESARYKSGTYSDKQAIERADKNDQ